MKSQGNTTHDQECVVCDAGFFTDEPDANSCKACNGGQYQDRANQTACKECGHGLFQALAGKSTCFAWTSCAADQLVKEWNDDDGCGCAIYHQPDNRHLLHRQNIIRHPHPQDNRQCRHEKYVHRLRHPQDNRLSVIRGKFDDDEILSLSGAMLGTRRGACRLC